MMEAILQEPGENVDFGEVSFVNLMSELHEIKGYKAAAIMTGDGELLYCNASGTSGKNLTAMMKRLNDFFVRATSMTEKSGFASCAEVSLRTGDEITVIRCSGKDCLVGIRLVVCLEDQCNVALLQRRLEKLLPRIMKCIVWEPDNLVPLYLRESMGSRGIMAAALRETGELAAN